MKLSKERLVAQSAILDEHLQRIRLKPLARVLIGMTLGLLAGVAAYMEKEPLSYAILGAALLVALGAFEWNGNGAKKPNGATHKLK